MGRTHLLAGTFVALTVFFYAGCAAKPRAAAPRQAVPGVPVAQMTKPDASDDRGSLGNAEAPGIGAGEVAPKSIAQHAEVYAHNLESLLAKRAAATQPRENAAPAEGAARPTVSEPAATGANGALSTAPPKAPFYVVESAPKVVAPATDMPAAPERVAARATAPAPVDVPPARMPAMPTAAAESRAQPAGPRMSPRPTVPTTVDSLQEQVSTRSKEYPRDAAAQLDYQLLQFLRDESVPDLGPLAALPAEDRDLLTTLLDGISNFRNGLRAESNMLQSKKVSPLLEMSDRLRGQGELSLPATVLCTKVHRFGVYEPMEPAQFKAGTNNEAVLYCEVANFSSQLGGRQWETRLKHESVLYSESGLAVWQDKSDPVTDQSRNRRHDFYVVKMLRVPALPVGRYLLKVSVTDLQVNRVAEATVPIQVVAQ